MILYTNLLTVLAQPQSQTTLAGQTTSLTILADGVPTLHYQWLLNKTPLAGATNSTLVISNASSTDAGTYSVAITNSFGSVVSSNATLTVNYPPSLSAQLASQAALVGMDVTFQVSASGTGDLFYQWYLNGSTPIIGATNAALTLSHVSTNDAGLYSVAVSNQFGVLTSDPAALSVYTSAASTLSALAFVPGVGAQFNVNGVPGLQYAVQASTNLIQWDNLGTNTAPFSFFDPSSATLPKRFFRAVYVPSP